MSETFDINSYPGHMLLMGGYFVFVGFIAAALAIGLTAHVQYKRGVSSVNVIGWTGAATLVLLLLALVLRLV